MIKFLRAIGFVVICFLLCCFTPLGKTYAQSFTKVTPLTPVSTSGSAVTGEKPQSKVWTYDGKWWAVFPSSGSTHLWRLDGVGWTNILTLTSGTAYADCKVVDNVTHILLYKGSSSELISLEYVSASSIYQRWSARPSTVAVALDASVETATIDVDITGRMWLASDASNTVLVRWSDAPYTTWSGPFTVASGINTDDISGVICMPGKTGVLWSNQSSSVKRFGFKTINTGADPSLASNWSTDEVPASQSAVNVGVGMADDHLNMSVASDGTLYCALKTSYDNSSYPRIILLVRRPSGTWDDLYQVPTPGGTRPIVILNETLGKVKVIYTTTEGTGNIAYRESPTSNISFGAENILLSGSYNNATSSKQNYSSDIVILASSSSQVVGVLASDDNVVPPTESLVGHWKMDEANGSSIISDASTYGNNGTVMGNAVRVAGKNGNALSLTTASDWASVPDNVSLDINTHITLAAWIRPTSSTTQYVIRKGVQGTSNGYELSLGSDGKPFFRLNQQASGNTYRVNAITSHPTNGTTWMHVAATYNGTSLKIYINGLLEATVTPPAPAAIATNNQVLAIGAQSDGTNKFKGSIDDVMIYNTALTDEEIMTLVSSGPAAPLLYSPANNATGISVSPALSWGDVTDAISYRLQVSSVADFTNLIFDQTDITATQVNVSGLANNTIYYWRVKASNELSAGDWSDVYSFRTLALPVVLINNGSGYALDFDGVDDYVTVPDNNSLDLTNSLTIETWVKPGALGTQRLVVKAQMGSIDGFDLSLSAPGAAADQKFFIRFNEQSTGDVNRVNSVIKYEIGKWYHLAATYDGASISLYVNGVLQASKTAVITVGQNNNPLNFGSQASGTPYRFKGSLDEIRIWNVSHTAAEVRELMMQKLAGTETGLVGHWTFNEENGSRVADQTPNANDGTTINMDGSVRSWSGASLGDATGFDYDAASGFTTTLAHPDGDNITVLTTSGTIDGIQLYRADDLPMRADATLPSGWNTFPLRFWGVKVIGTGTPEYTLVYNYTGHPDVMDERYLKLVKRAELSDNNWVDAGAILDMANKTLTITGATGTEYAFASSNAALPVTLVSFSGKTSGANNLLSWETMTENNNAGFYVERSPDGIQYSTLGFVRTNASRGNSHLKLNYSFIDESPLSGNNYYRLKQVDVDEKAVYSQIIIVANNSSAIIEKIYPNPVFSELNFSIVSATASPFVFSIVDVNGRIVKQVPFQIMPGNNRLRIHTDGIKSGIYFLRASNLQTGKATLKHFIKN